MKVYPAIYESTDVDIYLYKDRCNYYSFRHKNWIVGVSKWGSINPVTDKNITREYLANTYGMVESREHADFIVELAEANGIEADGLDGVETCFSIDDDGLYFWVSKEKAMEYGKKEITIPMPPKPSDVEATCEFSKSEMDRYKIGEYQLEKLTRFMDENGLVNIGDSAIDAAIVLLSASINEIKHDKSIDEWPQVGDEVETLGGRKVVLKLDKPDKNGMVVCDFNGEYGLAYKEELQKPLTPEESLEKEIKYMIAFTNYNPKKIAEWIISGEIEGLSYNIEKSKQKSISNEDLNELKNLLKND